MHEEIIFSYTVKFKTIYHEPISIFQGRYFYGIMKKYNEYIRSTFTFKNIIQLLWSRQNFFPTSKEALILWFSLFTFSAIKIFMAIWLSWGILYASSMTWQLSLWRRCKRAPALPIWLHLIRCIRKALPSPPRNLKH